MRNAPINFLITITIFSLIWIITGLLLSNSLSETVSLTELFPDEWRNYYLIITGSACGLCLIFVISWIIYGSNEKRVDALDKAKSVWRNLFILSIFVSIIAFGAMMILFSEEGIELIHFILLFFILFFQTTVLFWLTTFLFSPTNVEYIPLGK